MNGLSLSTKLNLTSLPTPLEPLSNLSRALGIDLWIKRDDLTSPAGGGNKVRKLEFLLADAVGQAARAVITIGAVQSNHCRQTSLLARKLGMEAHLVLVGETPSRPEGNLLLSQLGGAVFHFGSSDFEEGQANLQRITQELKELDKRPYLIPYGGSNSLGVQGYMAAYEELQEQARIRGISFDWIVHSSSSGGTQAGLLLAQEVIGGNEKVIGISAGPCAADLITNITTLIRDTAKLLAVPSTLTTAGILIRDQFVGPGYALLDGKTVDAIRILTRQEAILLDPVYTGKAFAGLLALARTHQVGGHVLFWHTGGIPALYSFADALGQIGANECSD